MPMYFKTTHNSQLNFQAELEIVSQLGFEKMTRQGFERPCVVLVPVDRKVKVMNRCRSRHPWAEVKDSNSWFRHPWALPRPAQMSTTMSSTSSS